MSNSVLVDLYYVSVPCNAMLDAAPMKTKHISDNKIHGANVGPTWVLSAPDGPHVGPMNLAIRDILQHLNDMFTAADTVLRFRAGMKKK